MNDNSPGAAPGQDALGTSAEIIDQDIPTHSADGRELSPAARRALAEAAARRKAEADAQASGEKGGPKGPEPTRYGDWERKGIAVDF